jgi:hypothetical protein
MGSCWRMSRAGGAAALMLALLGGAAHAETPCAAAVQKIQTMAQTGNIALRNQALDATNTMQKAVNTCNTQYRNAIIGKPQGDPQAAKTEQQCVDDAQKAYNSAMGDIANRQSDLGTAIGKMNNQVSGGNCPWSPEQISQMITALGQSISQIEQGTAQVISAAKGNGAKSGGTTTPQARPPATTPSTNAGSSSGNGTPPGSGKP